MASEDGILIIGGPRDGSLWFGTLHTVLQTHDHPPAPMSFSDFDKKDESMTMTMTKLFTYRLAAHRDHHGGEVIRVYVPQDMKDPDITAAVIKSYHARVLQETRAHQSKVTR